MKNPRTMATLIGRVAYAIVLLGLIAYVVAFYATSMPSVLDDAGAPVLRVTLLQVLLLCPDTKLFPNWFGIPPQFTLSDRLPVLLASGAILVWAALLGWLLLKACRANRGLTRLETAVFATGVGLSVLSTWTLFMGMIGQLDRTYLVTVPASLTLVAACFCWWRGRSSDNSRGGTVHETLPSNSTSTEIIGVRWLWLALPFVLVILLAAMAPPLDFDVCEYHLQAPKEFLQQGRITFMPHNIYANMPLGAEMLSLLGMVFVGDWWWGALVGKTVIAAFTPLCALALFAAGRRLYSTSVGAIAALVYISIPWMVGLSSAGLVEGVLACYMFLAVYALILSNESATPKQPLWQKLHSTGLVILAGYFTGGAIAIKYPAVLFVLVPLAAWMFFSRFIMRIRNADKPLAASQASARTLKPLAALMVFLLAAAVGCGLWLGKNWVMTGNPTYPLLYEVFGGKTRTDEKNRQWNRAHRAQEFSGELLCEHLARVVMTSELLSPLVVPLAALAFVGGARTIGRNRLAWELLAYVGFVIAAWWLLTHRLDRFWIPVLPVLALLAGMGAYWSKSAWWRCTLEVVLCIGLAANFLLSSAGIANAWFVPLDQLRVQWLSAGHPYFNSNFEIRPDEAVLTVGDAAVFDLKPPVFYNTCFDDCIFEQLVKGKTAAQIRAELASRHIAYVFVNWAEIARYRDTYGFNDFVQPEVFERLVKEGVLEPVPENSQPLQQTYRVK